MIIKIDNKITNKLKVVICILNEKNRIYRENRLTMKLKFAIITK